MVKVLKEKTWKRRLSLVCFGAVSIFVAFQVNAHGNFETAGTVTVLAGLFGVLAIIGACTTYDQL